MWKLLLGVVVGAIFGPQLRKAARPALREVVKASVKLGNEVQRIFKHSVVPVFSTTSDSACSKISLVGRSSFLSSSKLHFKWE